MGGWVWVVWSVAGVLAIAALVMLVRALLWDRARGRKRCPGCWYDMDAVPGLVCPECGREAAGERALRRTRRHWGRAGLACVLGVLAWGSWATPRLVRDGWSGAMPLWALYAAAPWFEDQGEALYVTAAATPPNMAAMFTAQAQMNSPTPFPAPAAAPGAALSRWERVLLAIECAEQIEAEPPPSAGGFPFTFGAQSVLARLTGQGPESTPAVLRMLRSSEDERVRTAAAEVLRSCHESQFRAVVRALERAYPVEQSTRARIAMLRTLVGLHHDRPEAVTYLLELLKQPEEEAVVVACISLGQMGERAASAAPAVQVVACTGSRRTALTAVATLRRLGEAGVAGLAATVRRSPENEVRRAAAENLAAPGSKVDPVAMELLAMLGDADPEVRESLAVALGRCYDHRAEVLPRLREHLESEPSEGPRVQCVVSIARLGDARPEVVEVLVRALTDESERVRYAAAMRLADFGGRAGSAEGALSAALDDPSKEVRREAARALEAIRAADAG